MRICMYIKRVGPTRLVHREEGTLYVRGNSVVSRRDENN